MAEHSHLIKNLITLNKIIETLNQAVNVQQALDTALARLVELMGVKTAWIFLVDSSAQTQWAGRGFTLAAYYNLPPAMSLDKARAWKGACQCQGLCRNGELSNAYNEVMCSRLLNAPGDRAGLKVHATVPLCSGDRILGILNVAAPDWGEFSEEALLLLTNIGSQMGIALDRAYLYELLHEKRIEEQSALLAFSNRLLSHTRLDALLVYLTTEIRALVQVDACAVLLPGDTPDTLVFGAASGWRTDPAGQIRPVTPGGLSQVALQKKESIQVADLQASEFFSDPADRWLVEGFRGHAVIPLLADGVLVGVLAINTRQPRLLSQDEIRLLQLMGNQAAIAIENARLYQEELKSQRLEEELAVARQMQEMLLPEACPVVSGWGFTSCYCPARSVGGDFYDFFDLPGKPDRLGLVIADVADKGIPAALFMAFSRTVIRTKGMSGVSPATVMGRSNRLIFKDSRAGLFVSAFYGILEPKSGRFTYTNGGHNRPLWLHADTGKIDELAIGGMVLGVFEQIKLEEGRIEVQPGDSLIFYTDGVTEAMDETDQLFGEARLRAVVAAQSGADAETMMQAIIKAVNSFIGVRPLIDDFTICVVQRLKM